MLATWYEHSMEEHPGTFTPWMSNFSGFTVCVQLSNVHEHGQVSAHSAASRFSSVSLKKKNLYLRHFKVCFGDPERTRGQKAAESVCFVKYLCTCDQLLQLWSLVFHSGRSELSSASRCRIHTKTQLKIGMLSREKSLICSYFTN